MELEEGQITESPTDEMQIRTVQSEIKSAGWFFFFLMILEIPVSFLIYGIQGLFPAEKEMLISVLGTQGYLLLGGIIYLVITKKSFVRDYHFQKYKLSTFFLSLLMLITASPMATVLNLLSQLFARNTTSAAILQITNQLPAWLGVIMIGCLPGFIEELLYRGILYQAFRKRSILTGVLVSAISFGVMHMNFNQMLYAMYLGIVFALLLEATGSIASTMILHMIFNAVNTAYVYILPIVYSYIGKVNSAYANFDLVEEMNKAVPKNQLFMMIALWTPIAIGGLVLSILLLRQIAKMNERDIRLKTILGDSGITSQVKPVTIGLLIGWAFCLSNAIFEAIAG